MQQVNEIKMSLKREYNLYTNAMAFYKNMLKELWFLDMTIHLIIPK